MPLSVFTPEPVVEVLHGRAVVDPYRWLEIRDSPKTAAWLEYQQQQYDSYFANISAMNWLRDRVSGLLNVESFDQPSKIGNHYFYRHRRKDQEQPSICMRCIDSSDERVLIDPQDFGPLASVAIHRISEDASLLAYELREGGGDAKAIHILDTQTGQSLAEHLSPGFVRGFAFSTDNSGFYYCHELSSDNGPHTVRFHRIGEAISQDRIVFCVDRDRSQQSKLVLLSDESDLGAVFRYTEGTNTFVDFYRVCPAHSSQCMVMPIKRRLQHGVILWHGRMLAVTQTRTSRRQIVEYTSSDDGYRTIVPACEHDIHHIALVGENIFIAYLVDHKTMVRRWTLAGEYVGTLPLLADGYIELHSGFSSSSDSLFCVCESYSQPPHLLEVNCATGDITSWSQAAPKPPAIQVTVKEDSYPSQNGPQIPISLVMRSDLDASLPHPLIATSYGGFGIAMTPRFSVLVTIMLELGAIFAVPHIRGGSEFGSDWHDAARTRKRRTAIDDFTSACDWLIKRHITSSAQLGIFGGSNSGLLVGAAMTQRPEMFRAVLCIAPLLDMVRYEVFDRAKKWRAEYGTTDDPDDFAALYDYSPYHRVKEGINYPATLFVSGDRDDRCNPAHVRKMAACLQGQASQINPILVDHDRQRGHCPVLPLSFRIGALTRRIAFLCKELGVTVPTGEQ